MAAPPTITTSKKMSTTIKYQANHIRFFKISTDIKRSVLKSLFNKVPIEKEAPTQIFSCEIIMNRFLFEYLRTTVSGRAQNFTKNGPSSNSPQWQIQRF